MMLRTISSFLKAALPSQEFCRFKGYKHSGWRQSPNGGPRYFPRTPDEPDPDIIPSKLFRIERVKKIKFSKHFERNILKQLGIHRIGAFVTVCKNTPEVNAQLWQVKHLVKITPITFPYGEPTDDDVNHTVLKENGECIVKKQIFVDDSRIKLWQDIQDNPGRMTGDTVRNHCRSKWISGWTGGF